MALGTMSIMVRLTILKYDWISSSVSSCQQILSVTREHVRPMAFGETH